MYALLLNFWISRFARFFAPPHGFSPSRWKKLRPAHSWYQYMNIEMCAFSFWPVKRLSYQRSLSLCLSYPVHIQYALVNGMQYICGARRHQNMTNYEDICALPPSIGHCNILSCPLRWKTRINLVWSDWFHKKLSVFSYASSSTLYPCE